MAEKLIGGKTFAEWQEFARRDDCLDQMAPSDLRALLALTEAALLFSHEATKALSELTPNGGSECFAGMLGPYYKADIPFCVERIRSYRSDLIDALHKARLRANALPALKEALEETRTDLRILFGNLNAEAKINNRFEGMPQKVNEWVARIDAALAKLEEKP